jgi:general secretion pathway protein G
MFMKTRQKKRGFTLVEIMIVVAIIGMLAVLGVPNMLQAGRKTRKTRFAREVETATQAFAMYASQTGGYPQDQTPGIIPVGMSPYLSKFNWSEDTAIGGQWDWDHNVFGITAGVSVYAPDFDTEEMEEIDAMIDDGVLSSGVFRERSGGYMYVLEE